MKKISIIALALVLLFTATMVPFPTALADDSGIATYATFTLTVAVNTGVESVTITCGSTTKTFTSTGGIALTQFATYTWTAVAKEGYYLQQSSGSGCMNSPSTLSVEAYRLSYTVTASYTPTSALALFDWSLEWASGKSLTGNPSDYVTMTVASDTKSVTLTFVKNFSAGEMVLTCYAAEDHTVKATCTVKCSS